MQQLPPLPAESRNPLSSRGHRQRQQKQKRYKPGRDVRPLAYILQYHLEIEHLVEPEIGDEVKQRVEEDVQPEHPPESNQSVPSRELSQWRNGKCDHEQPHDPVAGKIAQGIDGISA